MRPSQPARDSTHDLVSSISVGAREKFRAAATVRPPGQCAYACRWIQSTRAMGVGMSGIGLAQRYFDAWNAHDGDAIAATFADGGTYSDPVVSKLDGRATAQYANGLFATFPDLTFDLSPIGLTGDGIVAAQWLTRGTNTAPFQGHRRRARRSRCRVPTSSAWAPRGSSQSKATSTLARCPSNSVSMSSSSPARSDRLHSALVPTRQAGTGMSRVRSVSRFSKRGPRRRRPRSGNQS